MDLIISHIPIALQNGPHPPLHARGQLPKIAVLQTVPHLVNPPSHLLDNNSKKNSLETKNLQAPGGLLNKFAF